MKITTLVEDTTTDNTLKPEFGFSILIETGKAAILMDTGRSGRFIDNAEQMQINLENIDACVISHAHYDHGGGLERFFSVNKTTPVFIHEKAGEDYFANLCIKMPIVLSNMLYPMIRHTKTFSKPIGLDQDLLKREGSRFKFVNKPLQISEDAHLITDIRQTHPSPSGNKYLLTTKDGRLQPDEFRHEMILAVQDTDGIVLFSGCCHNGILNMMDEVKNYFEGRPIKAIVGGFHLVLQPGKDKMSCTAQQLNQLSETFLENNIGNVYSGHCTGQQAFNALKGKLGDRLHRLGTGLVFEL